jgi:hypothetical protein
MLWLTTPVWMLSDWLMNAEWNLIYNSKRAKDKSLTVIVHAILHVSILQQRPIITDMCLAMDSVFCCWQHNLRNVFTEPLSSNGWPILPNYSGFQLSCHNILISLSFIPIIYTQSIQAASEMLSLTLQIKNRNSITHNEVPQHDLWSKRYQSQISAGHWLF